MILHQAPMAHNPPNRPLSFEFPIIAQQENDNLKNIPSSLLLKFYGLVSEDPKNFLFEFDILCHSYHYTLDAHRLKLFPATLKEGALRWFMSLGRGVVDTWATMQTKFLEKYKEYCKSGSKGDDIFRIQQKEDENVEDYISRFMFSLKNNSDHTLNEESQKLLFLRGINETYIYALDLIGGGDITQVPWEDIQKICLNYSCAIVKKGRGYQATVGKSSANGVSRMEISNFLSDFKQDFINNMATQLDTMQPRKKHDEAKAILTEFFPHCRQKKRDCKCKMVANLEAKQLSTNFKTVEGDDDQVFFVAQRRLWTQRQGMPQDPLNFGNPYSNYSNRWQTPYSPSPPWNPPQPHWPNYQSPQWKSPQGGWK